MDMAESDLKAMIKCGYAGNYSVTAYPAWDNDNVGDIREDILTSISDGWDWGSLIRGFYYS
jgi:hypothetical protein